MTIKGAQMWLATAERLRHAATASGSVPGAKKNQQLTK